MFFSSRSPQLQLSRMKMNSRKTIEEFIDMYRSEPCLWKVESKAYRNRHKKDAAYRRLVAKLREVVPYADRAVVVKKINNLRTAYRKELRRVRASRKNAFCQNLLHRGRRCLCPLYEPKLWYFDRFQFLNRQESMQIASNPEDSGSESMENSSNEAPDADPQHSDSSVTTGPTISLDSIKTEVILPDDYDASAQSPSDDTAAVSTTSVATSVAAAPLPSLIMFNPLPKKPRIEPPSDTLQSTITAVTKDHHLRIPFNSSNLCISSPQSVQGTSGAGGVKTLTTSSNEDRFDVFGKNVACKLRDMDKTQRILVEKIINDALFEGEMGSLTRNHKLVDMPQSHQYKTTFLAI